MVLPTAATLRAPVGLTFGLRPPALARILTPAARLALCSPSVSSPTPSLAPSLPFSLSRPAALKLGLQQHRFASSQVSGQPASKDFTHMKKNIKEEADQVRESLEEAISGTRKSSSSDSGAKKGIPSGPEAAVESASQIGPHEAGKVEILRDARTIASELAGQVPRPALIWGAAGLLPYLTTSLATVYLARQQAISAASGASEDVETASALLLHVENVQIAYGAVILSFLGAIHWGLEFARLGGQVGHPRYMLGAFPAVVAWPTLLLSPQVALAAQWATFVAVWLGDLKATTAGWAPRWYSTYRFWLSTIVGASILLTLGGENYYSGTVATTGSRLSSVNAAEALDRSKRIREDSSYAESEGVAGKVIQGTVSGDVEARKGDERSEGFVVLENLKKKEEKKKEEEEEERRKKEEEEKKKNKEGKEKEAGK